VISAHDYFAQRKLQSRCAKGLTSPFRQGLFRVDYCSEKFSGRVLLGWRPVKRNVIRRANQKVYLVFLTVGAQQPRRLSYATCTSCTLNWDVYRS
jgi:hypothetical protein